MTEGWWCRTDLQKEQTWHNGALPPFHLCINRTISLTLVGQGIKQEVVESTLQQYHSKFRNFRRHAHSLQMLFQEAEHVQ